MMSNTWLEGYCTPPAEKRGSDTLFVSTRLNMWAKMVACIVKPTERKTELFFYYVWGLVKQIPKQINDFF